MQMTNQHRRRYWMHLVVGLSVVAGLAACQKRDLVLPGERQEIRAEVSEEELENLVLDEAKAKPRRRDARAKAREQKAELKKDLTGVVASAAEVPRLALPAMVASSEWTHKNGSTRHRIPHAALRGGLARVWTQNIGAGNGRRARISADPIVGGGRIYVMDAATRISAFSKGGGLIWSKDLTPLTEKKGSISGGGIAYSAGVVVATTGYGEVIAMDATSGGIRWRHRMDAGISAAPVITGDKVIAVARNNQALGLTLAHGKILWLQQSSSTATGIYGGGAPAATDRLVVVPFSSGEVIGALPGNGLRAWSTAVSGGRIGLARSFVGDISGDPVIDGDVIYLGNQAGRIVSVERRSGERNWTANEGAYGPVWPVGDSIFVVTDQSFLKRLRKSDGTEIWSVGLPGYKKPVKRKGLYAHYGPVLAGGRLIVASSDGGLRSFNPTTGRLLSTVALPGGAASAPAVADRTLYVVSGAGQLHAFK